jgi:large subunit ribosomal protein L24
MGGLKIRKGDTVQVISGDDKGKTGRVLSVDEVKRRIVVEKINFVKRHTKARKSGVQSGILEREAPIHISNVMLVDPESGQGARVGTRVLPDGTRERVSRASGKPIPKAGE